MNVNNHHRDRSREDVRFTHCANSIPLRVRYQTIYDSHQFNNESILLERYTLVAYGEKA